MLFLAFALAFQAATAPGPQGPGLRPVDKGGQSGIDEARQVIVRTSAEWTKLWRVHGMDRTRPAVNFTKEIVVGVFMGSRPTAGFEVEVVGVADDHGTRVVRYKETMPARDAMTAQVLTSPYVLVAIPKAAGEIKFEKVQ